MITLVLGGARSGKSVVAERITAGLPAPVVYVATVEVGDDAELAARVAEHRRRRPTSWRTVDAGDDVAGLLGSLAGTVLLDALGPLVAASASMSVDGNALCRALVERAGDTVVVSEEVGMGVHPSSESGRRFRDGLGSLNQSVAAVADDVLVVIAGRVLRLDAPEPA
ncbi:MAG: bifunctional adenosylcobinamide kinase/adenosylcobinamide-phosphate guanylyltransferase [Acidimicrobiales bacterium]